MIIFLSNSVRPDRTICHSTTRRRIPTKPPLAHKVDQSGPCCWIQSSQVEQARLFTPVILPCTKSYDYVRTLSTATWIPTCWCLHDSYKHGKIIITILIAYDFLSCYLVSGGPFAYLFMSIFIGLLSILGVYITHMALIIVIYFAYIVYGFVIFVIAFKKCFTALPPEKLYKA